MSDHRVIERILARGTPEPNTGCLLWTGYVNAKGYGVVHVGGRTLLAHRVVAGLADAPASIVSRHSCDQPGCIEPRHVTPGTVADNVADMHARGRARKARGESHPRRTHPELWPSGDRHWSRQQPERVLRGARNGRAKLSRVQVAAIRSRAQPGAFRALAREFGVSRRTVAQIAKGETWRG